MPRRLQKQGIAVKRTIGGWCARIGEHTWIFRRNDDRTWRAISQAKSHGAQPISSLDTLDSAVRWVLGHQKYCSGGCAEGSGPFDNVKVDPAKHPLSDDCHSYS